MHLVAHEQETASSTVLGTRDELTGAARRAGRRAARDPPSWLVVSRSTICNWIIMV